MNRWMVVILTEPLFLIHIWTLSLDCMSNVQCSNEDWSHKSGVLLTFYILKLELQPCLGSSQVPAASQTWVTGLKLQKFILGRESEEVIQGQCSNQNLTQNELKDIMSCCASSCEFLSLLNFTIYISMFISSMEGSVVSKKPWHLSKYDRECWVSSWIST